MKQFTGIVTSTKMEKTVVVQVTRKSQHPMYKKIMKNTKKYQVHNPSYKVSEGDTVTFVEHKPISKNKRFILLNPKDSQTK